MSEQSNQEPVVETLTPVQVQETPEVETVVTKEPEVVITQPKPVESLQGLIQSIKSSGSVKESQLINAVEAYCEKMAPGKPISTKDGAMKQFVLWSSIKQVIEKSVDQSEFDRLWNILVNLTKLNRKGAFADTHIYRFSEFWIWNENDLKAFQDVLNVLLITADEANKNLVSRKVSFAKTFKVGISEEGKNRIINFYR